MSRLTQEEMQAIGRWVRKEFQEACAEAERIGKELNEASREKARAAADRLIRLPE